MVYLLQRCLAVSYYDGATPPRGSCTWDASVVGVVVSYFGRGSRLDRSPSYTANSQRRLTASIAMSKVRASHLLVKYSGSRRAASWRDPEGAIITKKSKEQALDELMAFRQQIVASALEK